MNRSPQTMARRAPLFLALGLLAALAGCKPEEEAEAGLPPRPVLSIVVSESGPSRVGHAGTIEPRFTTDLAFRVGGRIVERSAEVGMRVAPDQTLATLDPLSLDLAVRSAEGDLVTAGAQADNARATAERQRALLARSAAASSEVESAEEALQTAEAGLARARSALDKAREQRRYGVLTAEGGGIVTAVLAEVGQTVTAGQAVMRLARDDVREAVVDLPEEIARRLSPGTPFDVSMESDPSVVARGAVREIAPAADNATRSRRVRITLAEPPAAFRLGTTVRASQVVESLASIDIPSSALLESEAGGTFVWVVDEASSRVFTRPVTVADRGEDTIRIASGIALGTRVVTAGANSLKQGQIVRIGGGMVR